MFCYNCGTKLEDDEKFCYACGAPVKIRRTASRNTESPAAAAVYETKPSDTPYAPKRKAAVTKSYFKTKQAAPEPEKSWGPDMPKEENQYSYPGNYIEYFDHLFRENFHNYEIICKPTQSRKRTRFYFMQSFSTKLVVELLSEKSAAQKVRSDCKEAGIPYLRFYYNHEGWWNTRSYVLGRVETALGI